MDKAIKGEIEMDNKRQMTNNWHEIVGIDVNLDELMYYMHSCDGIQFRKDMFGGDNFVDSYMTEKFHDFQDSFPSFLANLSDKYKTRFCVAVHDFYMNNHKEK